MALIRRVVVPAGGSVQVIPPDGNQHSSLYYWKIRNPTGSGGSVDLTDAVSKTAGQGIPIAAGDPDFVTEAKGDRVWAANGTGSPITLHISGTVIGD